VGAADNNFPFSRKMWNEEIIQPINALCENPPDGCDELSPLDEAEKDHIWTKKDVQDVHDKLEELCEDNDFDDLDTPQLDLKTIIEEILDAIQEGWCNCEPEEIELGTFYTQTFQYTDDSVNCCGVTVETLGGFGFCRFTRFTTYHAPYQDIWVTDAALPSQLTERSDKFTEAKNETSAWTTDRETELTAERLAKQLRTDLANAEEALQNAQNALDACVVNCSDEQDAVDYWQSQVDSIQSDLDAQEAIRDEAKTNAEEHLSKADAAATRNWELMNSLQYLNAVRLEGGVTKYPIDFMPGTIDLISISDISNKPWGLGPYPFNWVAAKTVVSYERIQRGFFYGMRAFIEFRYSPSGIPFADFSKNFAIDAPFSTWTIVTDTSVYVSPPCPALRDDDGTFGRFDSFWDFWTEGDYVKFQKVETSGTNAVTYDDL
jgi:hypothetical protein